MLCPETSLAASGTAWGVACAGRLPLTLGRTDGTIIVFAQANTFSYRPGDMARASLPGDRKSPDYEEVHLGFRGAHSLTFVRDAGWSERCRHVGFGRDGSKLHALHHGD